MKGLSQLQQDFQAYILAPEDSNAATHADILQDSGLAVAARLAIYHNAYRVRLHDALADAFGKSHSYLGDNLFYEMAMAFVDVHPSSHRNLRWFGAEFPLFLAERLSNLPAVAELAQFEWSLGLAFDNIDSTVIHPSDLAQLQANDWGTICFALQPSLQFLSLKWNAPAIWLALGEDAEPPAPAEHDQIWMIWRKNLQPHFRSVSPEEHAALQALQNGESFAAACARCAEKNPDASTQIGSWLHSWLQDGLLREFSIP